MALSLYRILPRHAIKNVVSTSYLTRKVTYNVSYNYAFYHCFVWVAIGTVAKKTNVSIRIPYKLLCLSVQTYWKVRHIKLIMIKEIVGDFYKAKLGLSLCCFIGHQQTIINLFFNRFSRPYEKLVKSGVRRQDYHYAAGTTPVISVNIKDLQVVSEEVREIAMEI